MPRDRTRKRKRRGGPLVVYVDLIFLSNLAIDGAVLLTTAWVRGIRPRYWRILAAAAIGAAYVVFMFVPAASFLYTFLAKIMLSLLMLWTAFGFGSLQHFVRNSAAFYGVNFAAAGGVLGIHYMLQSSSGMWDRLWFTRTGVGVELSLSLLFVGMAAAAALLLYRYAWSGRKKAELTLAHLAEVSVIIGGREYRCTGLVDTGNRLYDPLTRTPVMVMEAALYQAELPPSWLEHIKKSQVDLLLAGLDQDDSPWRDRLRLVPYRGINKGTQFMLAVKPDRVHIEREGRVYASSSVLIGLDGGKLAADGAYRAIIHPSLLDQS